jgi:hypothetical protein
MVVTKHFLAEKLGLDFEIAQFFADRKVPANNLYWHKRFLYLSFGTGFLFIPVIFDALHKAGADKDVLIDPERTARMEAAFQIVALHETKQLGFDDYIDQISALFIPHLKHKDLFDDLLICFKGGEPTTYKLGTAVPALNRADAFLFTFTDLPVDKPTLHKLISIWYHVAVTVLMLDDLVDLDDDRNKKEENAIIELGDNKLAVDQAIEIINAHLEGLKNINPTAEIFFRKVLDNALNDPQIKRLNEQGKP